ncbi:MAG TPA: isoprenylcysteine carboxylmethyltransferase family protein [Albitalea sp.]|nr:isoprenylcysteine carboxylmethyltransferase family protein [Albitalea sp.]
MALTHRFLLALLWLAWAAFWWAASRRVKPTQRSESLRSRMMHILPLTVAVILLWWPPGSGAAWNARFLPVAPWPFWLGAALTLAGLLFAVWARVQLGGNWSGIVTLKLDHALVTSGPYAVVRHPIYTGLLLAFAGTAIALGQWRGIVAVALVLWSFWRKLQVEERWMCERFGARYEEYRRSVATLVPFLW